METYKFYFKHPARCIIAGPSCCGKTVFIQRIILHREYLFSVIPQRIIYTYVYEQEWFSDFPFVEFTKEIPQHLDASIPSIIVVDDIICDNSSVKQCASLFTRGSHHMNSSVFLLSQNLFLNSSFYRNISLNTNYFVLFKTKRGIAQIEHLARQLFEQKLIKNFMEAYKTATKNPFTYLVIDLETDQEFSLRSNIFPGEDEHIFLI